MDHAVCIVPAAPIRRHASHDAEMISQILFGEYCSIIGEASNGFFRIRCSWDGYEGYCMGNQLRVNVQKSEGLTPFLTGWNSVVTLHDGTPMQLPFGSHLPDELKEGVELSGSVSLSHAMLAEAAAIRNISQLYLNTPYLWGGRSVYGADCSGFVQTVMKAFGVMLPRDAAQQVDKGEEVEYTNAACGDLAFFEVDGKIVHVGILLGPGEIIHAFGKVRKDRIDPRGIINTDTGERTHSLHKIRRLFLVQE